MYPSLIVRLRARLAHRGRDGHAHGSGGRHRSLPDLCHRLGGLDDRPRPQPRSFRASSDHADVLLTASPARVGWLTPFDVVVVVAVVNDLALAVEAQHRHSREGQFLAVLGPAAPPFDRGPVTGDDRLAELALDVFLLLKGLPR